MISRRLTIDLSRWTWCAPRTRDHAPIGHGDKNGFWVRPRLYDYGLSPDPRMPAEVLRRGFTEGA